MTTADTESRNIVATKAIYAAIPAGDLQTALALRDPEVRITYYGVDAIPNVGDYRSIDEAVAFFTTRHLARRSLALLPGFHEFGWHAAGVHR